MKEKTLTVLEYDKIIDMLVEKAGSEMTKKVISELTPSDDVSEIRERQGETTEAVRLINHKGPLPVGGFYDIEESVSFARKGGVLTMAQLLKILYNMKTAERVVAFLKGDIPDVPVICSVAELLAVHKRLADEIDRCIISEDEMADNASSQLRSIRRAIVRQNEALKAKINHILNSADNKTILQDSIVTMRNGRYVVPVKQEHRSRVPGIVHDQSGTGATLFIEPQAIVNLNNELRQLELDEKAEINRILQELSDGVSEYYHDLVNNQKLLLELDIFMAKGRLSIEMGGEEPDINENGIMELKAACHPLIDREKVVPVDISLGRDYRTLVITGPNTGGKTVTLKTAGLLSLMAQTGLHIPAAPGSRLPIYRKIFADIGDEQSIEQSLSTFSGHMKKITGILELAMPHTLVLLDELGAGTDPAEGAALAVAIIEELRRRGVLLMATTHYAELKVFALETKGVVNASCEFDLETLRPTYKLSVGVPGKSNAFLISEKLGIPERVIEAAQQHLSAEDKRLDAVLGQLDDLKLQLKESQDEVEELKNEASHQLEAAQKKRDELIQQGENELEAARAKARALAQQVESKAYALTDELRQLQKDERLSTQQKVQRAREIAKKESEKLFIGTEVVHNPVKEFVPLKEVKVGQEVCIAELNQLATVLALPDKNGDVLVRAGIIKTKVPLKGLKQPDKLIKESQPKTKAQQRYSRLTGDANRPNGRVERVQRSAKMELNLLGLTVDEALPEVDAYIDRAILNGQTVVYLIHGNGTGALRTAIHKHLRGNRMVKSFRLGRYGEGESGVTVVELK